MNGGFWSSWLSARSSGRCPLLSSTLRPRCSAAIRPTTARGSPLTRSLLAENGGPFALGNLVELGEVTAKPDPPQTEDCLFRLDRVQVVGTLSANRYLELLRKHACDGLRTIFGDALVRYGHSYAAEKGSGTVSLGILRLRRRADLRIDSFGKLRLRVRLRDRPALLPVTDARFVRADHRTIETDIVDDVNTRMRRGVEVLLMLGLARAFQRSDDDNERHWLQVNGICLGDRPLGERP